jgi:hypothetical protein
VTVSTDFFRAGTAYMQAGAYRSPEDRAVFVCHAVAPHPRDGLPRAFGFLRGGAQSSWRSAALQLDNWRQGWTPTEVDPEAGALSGERNCT